MRMVPADPLGEEITNPPFMADLRVPPSGLEPLFGP
jgi:hypothetical protein